MSIFSKTAKIDESLRRHIHYYECEIDDWQESLLFHLLSKDNPTEYIEHVRDVLKDLKGRLSGLNLALSIVRSE